MSNLLNNGVRMSVVALSIAAATLFCLASSAVALPTGIFSIPTQEMRDHCVETAGVTVFRQVKNVDGFAELTRTEGCNAGCQLHLLVGGFEFVEAKFNEASFRYDYAVREIARRDGLVPGQGLYRFERHGAGHSECGAYNSFIDSMRGARVDFQENDPFLMHCIATTKLGQPTARYQTRNVPGITEKVKDAKGRRSVIFTRRLEIVDMLDSERPEVIAQAVSMFIKPRRGGYAQPVCNEGTPENVNNLIRSTLIPAN